MIFPNLKILSIFASILFLFSISVTPIKAANNTNSNNSQAYIEQKNWTENYITALANTFNQAITGCDFVSSKQIVCDRQGIAGLAGNWIALMYAQPPASGIHYLANTINNFKLAKIANAQSILANGTGFNVLAPTLPLWEAFRNLAYLLIVVIFVVMGFAIMFRLKLSPQVTITIQSALPRIIAALLLITFSYAIAGLVVDLMYVILSLLVIFFHSQGLIAVEGNVDISKIFQRIYGESLFTNAPITQVVYYTILSGISFLSSFLNGLGIFLALIGAAIAIIFTGGAIAGPAAIAGAIVVLILTIILLYGILRLFFTLLISYIQIILGVIFGPIQILLGALPSESNFFGFGAWLKNLIANAMAFPTAALILILAAILVGPVRPGDIPIGEAWSKIPAVSNVINIQDWTNPLGVPANLGNGDANARFFVPPLLNIGSSGAIRGLIGFGLLMYAYRLVDLVKEALKTPTFEREIGTATGFVGQGAIAFPEEHGRRWLQERVTGARGPQWWAQALYRMFQRNRRWQEP